MLQFGFRPAHEPLRQRERKPNPAERSIPSVETRYLLRIWGWWAANLESSDLFKALHSQCNLLLLLACLPVRYKAHCSPLFTAVLFARHQHENGSDLGCYQKSGHADQTPSEISCLLLSAHGKSSELLVVLSPSSHAAQPKSRAGFFFFFFFIFWGVWRGQEPS